MHLQKGVSEGAQQELEELRRKNRLLNEELKRVKHPAEKPYEMQAKEKEKEHVRSSLMCITRCKAIMVFL